MELASLQRQCQNYQTMCMLQMTVNAQQTNTINKLNAELKEANSNCARLRSNLSEQTGINEAAKSRLEASEKRENELRAELRELRGIRGQHIAANEANERLQARNTRLAEEIARLKMVSQSASPATGGGAMAAEITRGESSGTGSRTASGTGDMRTSSGSSTRITKLKV